MNEHDQRFKALIREYFPELLELFFPRYAKTFDLSTIEWLEQEVFSDPPQGDVRILDLVARLMHRDRKFDAETVALVHIEIESRDSVAQFHRRMYRYYESLRRKHECPVLPIALFMRVGLDGVGVANYDEQFGDLAVLRFQYIYVGLSAMDAETYLLGDSWLGVGLSALMRMRAEQKVQFRAEALRRILVESNENKYRKLLLTNCVEAYLGLDDQQQSAFEQLLNTESYKEVLPAMQTTYDRGIEKGIEKGIEQGRRDAIVDLLQDRFGVLPEHVVDLVTNVPGDQLRSLLAKAARIESLDKLSQ